MALLFWETVETKEIFMRYPSCSFSPHIWQKLVAVAVGTAIIPMPLLPQAAVTARPSFEVASIKPGTRNEPRYFKFNVGDDRFRGTNMSLKDWIKNAWAVTDFEMTGAPEWISSENFDIDAKAERPIRSVDEGYQMLKSLLEDRFSLKVHRETKEMPMYSMVVEKNGVKMKLSADQTGTTGGVREVRYGRIAGEAVPVSTIAGILTGLAGRRVLNKTGLMNRYDVDLRYTPELGQPGATPEPTDSPDGQSLFGALQTQLGLKLESTRGPVEVLIVDHIEKLSAN
ncbi:MAG TPA: TIGR03435 family protein [Bryobacteraceae bacterium]|nr:TIGR03435 family protein [Bryobacteraceae bacterium]